MHYLIYKITNTINNKIYIGCHKTKDIDDGYMGSGVILKNAYKKYGETCFTKEIIFECETEDQMFSIEEDIVNEEFVSRLDTYNIALGGKCGSWYYANKHGINNKNNNGEKGGEATKKLFEDEEYRKEYCEKISNALKLYYKYNDNPWLGRKHKEETKQKIGKANSKNRIGEKNINYGKCWIYHENKKESIMIPSNEINKWVSEGWKKGRKLKF
jgi:hypothetical protein